MTEIVYYVAASLDGYIATPDGGVEWLSMVERAGEDYGYLEFYDSTDALLMGSRTYEQVLGFGEWPYAGKPCWVMSRQRLKVARPEITLAAKSPREVIAEIAEHGYRRVWLVGGGELAASFRVSGLISEYIVSIVPVILGDGIPLFAPSALRENLLLAESKSYPSGLVQLRYLQAGEPQED